MAIVARFDRDDETWARGWLQGHLGATSEQIEKCAALLAMLVLENSRQNLIAAGTMPFAWSRHVVDSAQLITHVSRGTSRTWLDLGTGGGFPGLACAIMAPANEFTLVEQRPLRTEWLEKARESLGLDNVTVKTADVGSLEPRSYDVISARAFAPLSRLLRLSAAFSTKATEWLLPKGRSAKQELEDLQGWRHLFHVEQSATDPQSGIIVGRLLGRK